MDRNKNFLKSQVIGQIQGFLFNSVSFFAYVKKHWNQFQLPLFPELTDQFATYVHLIPGLLTSHHMITHASFVWILCIVFRTGSWQVLSTLAFNLYAYIKTYLESLMENLTFS